MDVVVRGRNVEVPDHYRQLVTEKLTRIERFDGKLIRIDVELHHEKNPRQVDECQHVEITAVSRGPVVRSEARAGDFYAALDTAVGKLERRMAKAADRRRVHHGRHRPTRVADAAGRIDAAPAEAFGQPGDIATVAEAGDDALYDAPPTDEPGRIVRRKRHVGTPMTSDQALHEMELVGHDFYLFADAETGLPSVVYRRKGFAYGVITLEPRASAGNGTTQAAG